MSVPASGRLPRRVLVPVRLPLERCARAAELVAHGRRGALALPPLSPHHVAATAAAPELGWNAAAAGAARAPLAAGAAVQRLRPLVDRLVFVLKQYRKTTPSVT